MPSTVETCLLDDEAAQAVAKHDDGPHGRIIGLAAAVGEQL